MDLGVAVIMDSENSEQSLKESNLTLLYGLEGKGLARFESNMKMDSQFLALPLASSVLIFHMINFKLCLVPLSR